MSLGSLCLEEPCYGTSATAIERTNDEQPKYIRITDFDDFGIEADHVYMTAENYSSKHMLKSGDILFARTGATVGKTYYYDGSIGDAVFAGYCIRFHFDSKKVIPKFVYWYTKTKNFSAWVKGIQRPSGQPNINKEEYKSYKITLPTAEKQAALIALMDVAVKKRENRLQEANKTLTEQGMFILNRLNIKMPIYSEQLACAVRLADIRADRTFSSDYYHPERISLIHMMQSSQVSNTKKLNSVVDFHRDIVSSGESKMKYLGLAGVESNTGELSGVEEDAAGQAFSYQKGDVLYGRLRPYLNKVLLADYEGICSTEFHVMRVKSGVDLLPEYLAAIMRSPLILSQTKHMMTGNTHPRISNDDVQNLFIPVPERAIQQAIVDELVKRGEVARALKLEAEQEWIAAKVQFEKELLKG
jgi:Restriction endonuclease S subunits